ncbi:MAG TPA: DUF499 domain-containing protein [Candidatus Ozemobacteraceae bacterium]
MTNLKPWRETAVPHEDVLKGTFQQAEFAADISRVHDGSAVPEYADPVQFFSRTYITEGMRLLLDSVIKRVTGQGGDPVIQLQTAFGGGKTHTLLAVYHLARGQVSADSLDGVPALLSTAGVKALPKVRVAVLDGIKLSPSQPQIHGSLQARTLWGELAWQLGGDAAFEKIKDADVSGTSPGKELLARLLKEHAPCVILVDELVAYVRQLNDTPGLLGGTYDANLSFVQALTEAMKAVPDAVLLASLPESDREAGSSRGAGALRTLEHYFGRVQALWKPVATEEAFEIVRRRLFSRIEDRSSADAVCRAFADLYVSNNSDFPHETQESRYFDRIRSAYPIHPEVFDRLYEDWSSLDNFQRTRGVLKLMAKVIHRLWQDGNNDLMILPGSLPLYDPEVRNEAIYHLPQGWDPVLEKDIDGARADTTDIENQDTRLGSVQACRRTARTIFLGSAPSSINQSTRGIETVRILLGSAQPGHQIGVFKDALRRLGDRLHYLNSGNSRFWFDTRPNLRREMEERKKRFKDREDLLPKIRTVLQSLLGNGMFAGTHIFTSHADIPDDGGLRLIVLAPADAFAKKGPSPAADVCTQILKSRGQQPRQRQNRLLFLAPDQDGTSRLWDNAKTVLAWKSIVDDCKEGRLNLDQLQAKQAEKSLKDTEDVFRSVVRESWRWVLAPFQEAQQKGGISELRWETAQLNTSASQMMSEIERVLKTNELVIDEWSPIHLANLLKKWFWNDETREIGALDVWQKMGNYLYLGRLRDDTVYRRAIEAGLGSRDFFGIAYGKTDGKYEGFSFGRSTSIVVDGTLLLVEPHAAKAFEESLKPTGEVGNKLQEPKSGGRGVAEKTTGSAGAGAGTQASAKASPKRRFFGNVEVNPVTAKIELSKIVDEVLVHLASKHGVSLKISLEVSAEAPQGFDDDLQRTIRENGKVLNFTTLSFEEE